MNNESKLRKTTEQFIEDAKAVHGDKYDYSKAEYIGYNKKLSIVCPQHGKFMQTPESHLRGSGCPKCRTSNRPRLDWNEVLKRFKNVHGDKYDYSKAKYITKDTNIEIICTKHGSFLQTPDTHWRGGNCPECNKEARIGRTNVKRHSGKSHTQESFLAVAKEVHNNFYDYSKVNYTKGTNKIIIICPIHGEFEQTARKHLEGHGCKKCAKQILKNKTAHKTKEWFIEQAKSIHGDKFDYSNLKYTKFTEEAEFECKIHGKFNQLPRVHLLGCGCPKCGVVSGHNLQRKSTEQFIIDAKNIHGDTYDYTLVEYIDAHTPVTIICKEHGEFQQTPTSHINKGRGCPKCTLKSQTKLLNKLIEVFPEESFTWEYTSDWLQGQRIDICLEKYKIGIEYDGKQHFVPVERFGGELALQNQIKSDILKNEKCKDNNFTLFRVKYDYTDEDFEKLCSNIRKIIS